MGGETGGGRGPKGAAAFEEIEARLSQLFGVFGKTLGDALQAAQDGKPDGRERVFEQTLDTDKGPMKMRAGLSLRFGGLAAGASDTGAAGSATGADRDPARPVKPGRTAPPAPTADEPRAPLLDIYDADGVWSLTAELPGVAEAEVAVTLDAGRLTLATTGARRFHAEAALPDGLDAARMERALVNGILEIRIPHGAAS